MASGNRFSIERKVHTVGDFCKRQVLVPKTGSSDEHWYATMLLKVRTIQLMSSEYS
jgi:hypothetical protein